ncbi:MAG: MlaD family protein [Solirubrobacterales bacterium]
METRPPTIGRIAIAAGFALSCFGLLLFLWLAFGGPVPLKPESYRIDIHFDEASQLAVESDVRISGVSVGKVKAIELGDDGLADATIEIDPKYAPIPSNTKAILRQKTLLGETYVELTPGDRDAAPLPEGGTLATAQVSDAVQLDEIFRAFDEPTRAAFQTWMADAAVAFHNRGADLNAALGNLDPFAESADELLQILDSQRLAVKRLLADGGATFDAISKQPGELRSLIENTQSVFATTAARDTEIREIFQALPTFEDEARLTLERLDRFAADTNPLITQLRPVARQLSGTLIALKRLAPEAERFFHGLRPVIRRAQSGFGSLRVILDDELPPFLGRLDPYFDQLIPILDTVDRYKREVTAFLANTSTAINAASVPAGSQTSFKYLRATGPLGPAVLGSPPSPYKTSRFNAYVKPGGYTKLSQGLDSFFTAHCSSGLTATVQQGDFTNDLWERTQFYALGGLGITNTDDVAAPPCRQQGKVGSIGGAPAESTHFPHVNAGG